MDPDNIFKEFIKAHKTTLQFLNSGKENLARTHYLRMHELYQRLDRECATFALRELAHSQLLEAFNRLTNI